MDVPPAPRILTVSDIGEANEGVLARIEATVTTIEPSSTGSLTLIVEDDSGQGRVYAHAPLGLTRSDFAVGQRIAVIGLVGDRLALYRLWPRSKFDIEVLDEDEPHADSQFVAHADADPIPHAESNAIAHTDSHGDALPDADTNSQPDARRRKRRSASPTRFVARARQ